MRISRLCVILFVMAVLLVPLTVTAAEFDLGGQTITITTWSGRVNRYLLEDNPGRIDAANEKFNVNVVVEQFPKGELAGVNMSRLLSGDSAWDVWNMEHDQFWPLVSQGALLPTNDFLGAAYYEGLHPFHQKMANAWTFLGSNYYVGSAPAAYTAKQVFTWNKDIIEAEGQPSPYELWLDGEWNWDTMEEIMRAVTRDTTGDGEIDQGGYSGIIMWDHWVATNGSRVVQEIDGRLEFTLHQEESVYALNKIHEWRQEGIARGVGWENAAFSAHAGWSMEFRAERYDGHRWGVVPWPQGPHQDSDAYSTPFWAELGYALPANSANPEAVVAVLDFLFPASEFEDHLDRMIRSMVLDRDSYDALQWSYANTSVQVDRMWRDFIGGEWFDAAHQATGEGNAASLMEAHRPAAQAALDEMFND